MFLPKQIIHDTSNEQALAVESQAKLSEQNGKLTEECGQVVEGMGSRQNKHGELIQEYGQNIQKHAQAAQSHAVAAQKQDAKSSEEYALAIEESEKESHERSKALKEYGKVVKESQTSSGQPRAMEVTLRPATKADAPLFYSVIDRTMREFIVATWGAWNEERVQRESLEDSASPNAQVVQVGNVPVGVLLVEREPTYIQVQQIGVAEWRYESLRHGNIPEFEIVQ